MTTTGTSAYILQQWQQAEDDVILSPMPEDPERAEELFLLEQAWLLGKLSVATYMRATGTCLCAVRGVIDDACENHP